MISEYQPQNPDERVLVCRGGRIQQAGTSRMFGVGRLCPRLDHNNLEQKGILVTLIGPLHATDGAPPLTLTNLLALNLHFDKYLVTVALFYF